MDDRAPHICLTRAEDVVGERWEHYARCLRAAGGEPVAADLATCADPAHPPAAAPAVRWDGLLVTAGVDVDPARYGEVRSDRVLEVDPRRDAFEAALIAEAARRRVPVLAICRGAQLLNVVRGGALVQHLAHREPHRARRSDDGASIASGWHAVAVAPGSLLERTSGRRALTVNSRHHQAITRDRLAPGLVASGVAPDGVVEAIEDPSQPWVLGLQWHPERPEMSTHARYAPGSTRIFAAFVEACRAARSAVISSAAAAAAAARGDSETSR